MAQIINYKVNFLHQSGNLHPFLESPFNSYISDYLNDEHSAEYLRTINFLKKFAQLEGKQSLETINSFLLSEINQPISKYLFTYHPALGLHFPVKKWHDYDPLEILCSPDKNLLIMIDGMLSRYGYDNHLERCTIYSVDLNQWLYLWDWWQAKKAAGLQIETGEIEIPIVARPKYSIYKPLAEYLEKDIPNWMSDYTMYKELQKYLSQLERKINPTAQQIATLRDLSTRRPLLAREKIELDFIEKIQDADSSEALQSLENELNNTATDPQIKTQLQKYIIEKKAFY